MDEETEGNKSIFQAIEQDLIGEVSRLVKLGQIDDEEDGGWNPLHAAARKGNVEIVSLLIESIEANDVFYNINSYFEILDSYGDYRGTALSEALLHNNTDVARLLVTKGANVNDEFFSQDQVEYRLSGWDYDAVTKHGICWWLADGELLTFMMPYGVELEAKISRCGHEEDALIIAIRNGNTKRVSKLLELGVAVNRKVEIEDFGLVSYIYAAVIYAIKFKRKIEARYNIIRSLIQYGALFEPVESTTSDSPLVFILEQNRDDVIDGILGIRPIRDLLKFSENAGAIEAIDLTDEFRRRVPGLTGDDFLSLRLVREQGRWAVESNFLAKGCSIDSEEITKITRKIYLGTGFCRHDERAPLDRWKAQEIEKYFWELFISDSCCLGSFGFSMKPDHAVSFNGSSLFQVGSLRSSLLAIR
nr:ankyrin repeat domain-containing protein [Desulfuromonas thiophila]